MAEKRLGRYVIEHKLGEGGMGDVYLGFDPESERMVAIKTIRPELLDHPKKLQRFQREIDLQRQVKHPNVVEILDLGEDKGRQFLVLEYVEGKELADMVPPGGMDISQAVHITERVCLAMNDVHDLGIIHRDMKPANVLLDGLGNPHIIDFGVAKSLSGEDEVKLTKDGGFVGTLEYASPEQAEGRLSDVDRRSDIFNLGAMLYKLLTGRTPFFDPKKTDPNELRMRIVRDHPIEPRKIRPEIPSDLESIVLKSLAKDLKSRYQTAQEMAEDLAKFRAGERVRVAYSLKADKLSQWVTKHRGKIATVAVFLIALCAVSFLFAEQLRRQNAEQEERAREIAAQAWTNRKTRPVEALVQADRVLLNHSKGEAAKTAAELKKDLVPRLPQVEAFIEEARVADDKGDTATAALKLARAYALKPDAVTSAGFHYFDGQWLTTEDAREIGVLDAQNKRREGRFFFGQWLTRDQAIKLGHLLLHDKTGRLLNGAQAKSTGWVHRGGKWFSPTEAERQGMIYHDKEFTGRWLDPGEAQARGFTYDAALQRWLTVEESESRGRGLRVDGEWLPADAARRSGYRFNGERWYHLASAWSRVSSAGAIRAPEQLTAIAWGQSKEVAAFGSLSGKIYLYSKINLGRPLHDLFHGPPSRDKWPKQPLQLMIFDRRDQWLMAFDDSGLLVFYEVTGRRINPRRWQPTGVQLTGLHAEVVRDDITFFSAWAEPGKLRIDSVPSQVQNKKLFDVDMLFNHMAWAHNGRDILLASATELRQYDLEARKFVGRTLPMPGGSAEAFVNVAFIPSGVTAVSVGDTLTLLDPRTGNTMMSRKVPGIINDISFDVHGETLIVLYRPKGRRVKYDKVAQGMQFTAAGVR